jgi:hypothetical protein
MKQSASTTLAKPAREAGVIESHITTNFRKCFATLQPRKQKQARENYSLWLADPFNSTTNFTNKFGNLWSAEIGRTHRTLGRMVEKNVMLWFWIGTHEEYNKLLRQYRKLIGRS